MLGSGRSMDIVRVGIVGLGFSGTLHAESYALIPRKAKIVAVCDTNKDLADRVASMYGASAFTDYNEMLEHTGLDALDICVPYFHQARIAVAAVEKGKHILIEKPIATSFQDARRIVEAARKKRVKLMVAHNLAFVPAFREARRLIKEGRIGRVFLAKVSDMGYDRSDWRERPDAKGLLLDDGIHCFHLLQWIIGPIDSVCVLKTRGAIGEDDRLDYDAALVLLKLKNGAIGEVAACYSALGGTTDRFEAYGTEGTIFVDLSWEKPLKFYSEKQGSETSGWEIPEIEHATFPGYYPLSFGKEVRHFLDCILEDKEPDVTGEDAIEALKVSLAACEAENGVFQKVGGSDAKRL
jgi:predicted dehydrogenase